MLVFVVGASYLLFRYFVLFPGPLDYVPQWWWFAFFAIVGTTILVSTGMRSGKWGFVLGLPLSLSDRS
jgi:hypothetical protein